MAFLWADSPDYYDTSHLGLQWNVTGAGASNCTVVASGGRRSGKSAIDINPTANACYVQRTFTPGDATIAIAFAFIFDYHAPGVNYATFFAIGDGTVWHVSMQQNADTTISFYMGRDLGDYSGGTLIGTTTWTPVVDTYYSFNIKCTINNTTGALSFKVNGDEKLNGGAGYTNIDTQNGGTAGWTRIGFYGLNGAGKTPRMRWCDIVVNDGTTGTNNTHPGDCSVLIDLPNTGNGGNTGFTPSSGGDHGAMVDDNPEDEDTTYNASTASGQRDSYVFPSLALSSGTIKVLVNRMCLKLSESGASNAVGVIRDISGATNYDSATILYPSDASYAYFDDIRLTDPATSNPWDVAGVNDSELGVKRNA